MLVFDSFRGCKTIESAAYAICEWWISSGESQVDLWIQFAAYAICDGTQYFYTTHYSQWTSFQYFINLKILQKSFAKNWIFQFYKRTHNSSFICKKTCRLNTHLPPKKKTCFCLDRFSIGKSPWELAATPGNPWIAAFFFAMAFAFIATFDLYLESTFLFDGFHHIIFNPISGKYKFGEHLLMNPELLKNPG